MSTIRAIILDGFHKGHTLWVEYMPTIKLLKPRNLSVDYCCGNDIIVNDPIDSYVEYRECFRAVDGDIVLYSVKGTSMTMLDWFVHEVTSKPWSKNTTLYFGYHGERIERKDDGQQKTDYEMGFERGVEEGRIIQQKEFDKR